MEYCYHLVMARIFYGYFSVDEYWMRVEMGVYQAGVYKALAIA